MYQQECSRWKVFHKHHEKFKPHPKHVQEDAGEQIPDEKITQLVEKNAVQIKARANLDTETDEDKKELETASVDALAYIKYSDAEKDIYLIKVIIGNQFIVHIKIGVKKGSEQDAAGTLMTVLPDKEETDKLNKAEFN
ncbi:uncharacterized protein LOC110845180 isoform X2 [Folsomia candida]|uniref:uncharacterized protein LOC110845180 isoform X2 n=1 Tax=Folsomia candida TaxID=158441 RepID=UPI001604CD65|nr:uncharacterized protein LOC110845180 isoform X2 [Folsomia candida]